jgi:pimeloyl-ACP methyl ester carboxylesterase
MFLSTPRGRGLVMVESTQQELFTLEHRHDAERRIRLRVEGPHGYQHAPRSLPYVLVLHGFKGFMNWGFFPLLSRRLARAGIVAISFNVSGSGIGEDLESFTDEEGFAANTLSRELEDIELVRTFARSGRLQGVDPGTCALFGHSRGGGTMLIHAAEHGDARALVTWSAVENFDRFDEATKQSWREQGYIPIVNARTGQVLRLAWTALEDLETHRARLDPLAAARRLRLPALFVHGAADDVVPAAASRELHAAYAGSRLLVIEGAGHTFGAKHPLDGIPDALDRALDATIAFFSENL